MPNTSSSKKRHRQNEKLRVSNRAKRSKLRGQLRRVRDAVKAGDSDAAMTELRIAQKRIDQAAAKNLLHDNTASRTKSRLNKMVKAIAK
jgi:small subunit ribosomal protein S20